MRRSHVNLAILHGTPSTRARLGAAILAPRSRLLKVRLGLHRPLLQLLHSRAPF